MKIKLKTNKSTYKRIKISKNKLIRKKAYKAHLLSHKSNKRLFFLSKKININSADKKNILNLLKH